MDSISSIAEQYLRVSRGEIQAEPEFLRRTLLEKFAQLSNAEKLALYRANATEDNPLLKLVNNCSENEAWDKIELVEATFIRAARMMSICRLNETGNGDWAGDIHKNAQVSLVLKTVLSPQTQAELVPFVSSP